MGKSGQGLFVWAAAWLIAVALLVPPAEAQPKPNFQLEPSGQAEVDRALAIGFNLPELVAAATRVTNNTSRHIEAAIDAEQTRLATIVRALGYLDARLTLEPSAQECVSTSTLQAHGQDCVTSFRLRPDVGSLYRIGAIEVLGLDDDGLTDARQDISDLLALYAGRAARGDILSEIENGIIWRVRNASYAFSKVVAREIMPDPLTATALIRMTIEMGPPVSFGAVTFRGLVRADVDELSSYVPFSAGDAYSVEALEQFRHVLESLPMLRTVRVALADTADAEGRLPIQVQVREAPPDPRQLFRGGTIGLSITAGALGFLGLRQLLLAAGVPRHRFRRGIELMMLGLVVVAAQLGWQRLVQLAGIG